VLAAAGVIMLSMRTGVQGEELSVWAARCLLQASLYLATPRKGSR
jgi:hypothetical protein